jgi:hypothetical protein
MFEFIVLLVIMVLANMLSIRLMNRYSRIKVVISEKAKIPRKRVKPDEEPEQLEL